MGRQKSGVCFYQNNSLLALADNDCSFAVIYMNGYGESSITIQSKGLELPKEPEQKAPVSLSLENPNQ